jgi:hypothetical protein
MSDLVQEADFGATAQTRFSDPRDAKAAPRPALIYVNDESPILPY